MSKTLEKKKKRQLPIEYFQNPLLNPTPGSPVVATKDYPRFCRILVWVCLLSFLFPPPPPKKKKKWLSVEFPPKTTDKKAVPKRPRRALSRFSVHSASKRWHLSRARFRRCARSGFFRFFWGARIVGSLGVSPHSCDTFRNPPLYEENRLWG